MDIRPPRVPLIDRRTLIDAVAIAIFIFTLISIAGCDLMPKKTDVATSKVPVGVPCKTKPVPEPVWPMDSVDPKADPFTLAKSAIAEIERRREYEASLKAANAACQ